MSKLPSHLFPCRIFVVGIGFFSLCFLMTSLGGQFSAKRLGDSPFTIRTEGTDAYVSSVHVASLRFMSQHPLGLLYLKLIFYDE